MPFRASSAAERVICTVTCSASCRITATAAWADGGTVSAAAARHGIAFGSAKALKIPGLGDAKPQIAVDGRSAVTATWSTKGRVMAATCSASGHCGRAHALSPTGENATNPKVAVASDGTAVVAWKSSAGVSAVLRHGHNEQIRRLAQEIIVTQQQEIAVMRLAVGDPLPPAGPVPTQPGAR